MVIRFNFFSQPVYIDGKSVFVHKLSVAVPKTFQKDFVGQQLSPVGGELF